MDIATLASATVAALVPFLKTGAEKAVEGAGGDLWNWVKSKFSSKGKDTTLKALEEKPDDAKQQGKVEGAIEDILNDDDSLIDELKSLLEKAQSTTNIINNTTTVTGDNNNVIQGVSGSSININSGSNYTTNHYYNSAKPDAEKAKEWKQLIASGKISDAIEQLLAFYKDDEDKQNTLFLPFGQYNNNESNYLKSLITNDEANRGRAKVSNALLELFK